LFVDESGSFEDADGTSCVVGIVVEAPLRALPPRCLEEALKNDVPWLPWPLHASFYNLGAYHLISWMRAKGKQRSVFPLGDKLGHLENLVLQSRDEPSRDVRKIVARPDVVVPYELVCRLQRSLEQTAPDAMLALRTCVDLVEDRLRKRLGALSAETKAFVVAAAAAPDSERDSREPDLYLSALAAMLERLASLVLEMTREIWPVIAVRGVSMGGTPRLLDASLVGRLWTEAVRTVVPGTPPPMMWPAKPDRYDARVHPGLVLADFVANRLRGPLSSKRTGWQALRGTLATSVVLPVSLPLDGIELPSVAADGAARQAVRLARTYGATQQTTSQTSPWLGELERCTRAWAREQATAWTTFLSSASGGQYR
jgi:hypothetical protein